MSVEELLEYIPMASSHSQMVLRLGAMLECEIDELEAVVEDKAATIADLENRLAALQSKIRLEALNSGRDARRKTSAGPLSDPHQASPKSSRPSSAQSSQGSTITQMLAKDQDGDVQDVVVKDRECSNKCNLEGQCFVRPVTTRITLQLVPALKNL
ncbi:unnamed protein product [Cylicocyclus nassatus]|uniref:Uncharacterized protein n=1 Tax=Cylicocyclus nassatus TaxID=53992 RepID=A0AA36GE56_CYLNA|nr:unnamed protein product [Cylicocyclus nassatus]